MTDSATVQVRGNNDPLKQSLAKSFSMLKQFATGVASSFAGFAIYDQVSRGIAGIGSLLVDSVHKAEEAERSMIKFDTVLENTGNKTGFTRGQLLAMNKVIAETTEYSAGMARAAEIAFIKMENIRGEVFERALSSAADLAEFLEIDMAAAAETLGRALQNPETGMLRLRRAGIMLTVEEKARIKQLQESNDLQGAQIALVSIIERKFKGLRQEMAGTFGGQLKQFNNELNKTKKELGEALLPIASGLLPVLSVLVTTFSSIAVAIATILSPLGSLIHLLSEVARLGDDANESLEKLGKPKVDNMGNPVRPERKSYTNADRPFAPYGSTPPGEKVENREIGFVRKFFEYMYQPDVEARKKRQRDMLERNPDLNIPPPLEQQKKLTKDTLVGTFEEITSTWKRMSANSSNKSIVDVTEDAAEKAEVQADELLSIQRKQATALESQNVLLTQIRDKVSTGNLANA